MNISPSLLSINVEGFFWQCLFSWNATRNQGVFSINNGDRTCGGGPILAADVQTDHVELHSMIWWKGVYRSCAVTAKKGSPWLLSISVFDDDNAVVDIVDAPCRPGQSLRIS